MNELLNKDERVRWRTRMLANLSRMGFNPNLSKRMFEATMGILKIDDYTQISDNDMKKATKLILLAGKDTQLRGLSK